MEELFFEEKDGAVFLRSRLLAGVPGVRHLFATRRGGVSQGPFASANFRHVEGDPPENVRRNYEIFCRAGGLDPGRLAIGTQTHTDRVYTVTKRDAGRGYQNDDFIRGYDAFVTDVPGLVVACRWADCVPILLCDPVRRAVGAVHAGWRGTLAGIVKNAVRTLGENYGSRPEDVLAVIGPAICGRCMEVGGEVAAPFAERFAAHADEVVLPGYKKPHLELRAANKLLLAEAGLPPAHIAVSALCTREDETNFFSHRRCGEARGVGAAFISMDGIDPA